MIESLFITIFLVGIIFTILAIYYKSTIFASLSILSNAITLAQSMYIQQSYAVFSEVTNATTKLNVTTGSIAYNEPAFFALSLGIIFVDILWIIYNFGVLKYKI